MKVTYTKDEFNILKKEVCFIMNDLKQLTEMLCSNQYGDNNQAQANMAYSAIPLCDSLKGCLVQMNFIAGNKLKEEEVNDGTIDSNNSIDSDSVIDAVDQVPERIEEL